MFFGDPFVSVCCPKAEITEDSSSFSVITKVVARG